MVPLIIESWIWWSFVILVAGSRFLSRRIVLGSFREYQLDDWGMIVVLCFYTTLIPINIVAHTSSNLIPPGTDIAAFTPQDIAERTYGSKLVLVVEQTQICSIWGAKACLLVLYLRLTTLRRENIAIKVIAAYVTFGFVFMEVFYFAVWCRPFHDYWAVPTPNVQCDAATDHLITNAVLNLSSDVAMLMIGLPMFIRMSLPWRKKIPLIGIFSLGVFVVLAAILNKVYSFSQPFGPDWVYWYIRESSTALLVANLPFVWTVWRKLTGGLTTHKTVNGVSRNHSGIPESIEQAGSMTAPARRLSHAPEDLFEGAQMDLVDMKQKKNDLTLADVLNEGQPSANGVKAPDPLTHPQLFYSNAGGDMTKPKHDQSFNNSTSEQAQQRSSLDGDIRTSASSLSPYSLAQQESAGSFV